MASTKPHIESNVLDGDGIRIVGHNVLDAFLYIASGGILYLLGSGIVQKNGKHSIEVSSHFQSVIEFVSSATIDIKNCISKVFSIGNLRNYRLFFGEISCSKDGGSVASGKANPGVLPRIFLVCKVGNLGVGIHQKGIAGGQKIFLAAYLIHSVAGNNIVDEIVVSDSRAPLVQRVAFLKTDIIDRKGN